MSDGAEPFEKTAGHGAAATSGAAPRPAPARAASHRRPRGAGVRSRSDGATLAFAVTVAVALGVGCGIWVNSVMTSAASAGTPLPPRATHDARPAAAAPPTADRGDAPAPAGESETPDAPTGTAEAAAAGADTPRASEEGRTSRRAAAAGATDAARDAGPREKAAALPAARPRAEKSASSERAQEGRTPPCGLYASAGSLSVRGGGAAPLVVVGPGEGGRVSVTTPDWSNIAVLEEGRTGNGWVRYSVRSVSGRPGVYALRFATPCGSKSIPVTVTR